ncbi:MAG: cation:proton antiporter [Candidatus Hydrothermota bacterium]|nr:MAG: cation:proton antiporter [Candidatus Hydrothermae bacterium]
MIRNIFALLLILVISVFLASSIASIPFGTEKTTVGKYYLDKTIEETGSVNTVTSVVVLYRGFDTLGEVTVLFLAATGLGAILFGLREKRKRKKERPSLIMRTGTRYLFTAALLFGAYVFVHGHLTPGGGFPGGVIVATAFLMLFLAQEGFRVSEKGVKFVEALAGMTYVAIGIAGLLLVGSFLGNFLGTGIPNKLASAGIIPLIYITIGLKVGSEITGLLQNMRETTEYES